MSLFTAQRTKIERQNAQTAMRSMRQVTRRQQQHMREVEDLSKQIVGALRRGRNSGVVYADSEDLLYTIIAIEIGLIEEITDLHAAQQHARHVDNQFGRRKHQQGDRQRLMRDAVDFAVTSK
ncbi:MAG: hypothetical protein ACHQTE_01150, partial [Candidatus Saccharimonadales bacterium]